jgi:transglutaminase-like putative cysteine protease
MMARAADTAESTTGVDMTSRLLMPGRGAEKMRRLRAAGGATGAREAEGSTLPTPVLDWRHPAIQDLVARVRDAGAPLDALRAAHAVIAREVRPVYSVEDRRRASRTLVLGRGSCSQRMAVLEAVARALGVPTRVQGLLVDGSFWYPRFPRLKPLVPEQVLLAWPEFRIDGAWLPIGELFGHTEGAAGFANRGGETLFEAVARTGLRWDGARGEGVGCGTADGSCDLSAQVVADLGYFGSRDELFTVHGQTLCRVARTLGEPVLGRWSAGARATAA